MVPLDQGNRTSVTGGGICTTSSDAEPDCLPGRDFDLKCLRGIRTLEQSVQLLLVEDQQSDVELLKQM